MNIRYVLTFFILLPVGLPMSVHGATVNDRFCQVAPHVYFGNGVWNSEQDADNNASVLEIALESKLVGTELADRIIYGTSHNPTDGYILDLMETFLQNEQTSMSQFWRYLSRLDPLPNYFQDKLTEIANTVDAGIVAENPAVQQHIGTYDKALSEGNKVIVVAHSQGNLFANIAHLGLNPEYKSGFGIVGVASPDSFVAGTGPNTTIDEDLIIASVFNSMDANVNNFENPNYNSLDYSGHQFTKSYMLTGHPAREKILNDVVGQIESTSYPETELGQGIITTSLTWGINEDLDIHIYEPNGMHVYYDTMMGPSGYIDLDDVDSYGPEHYFVSCETIETGTYRFGVVYYWGESPETAVMTLQAGDQTFTRELELYEPAEDDEHPFIMFNLEVTGTKEDGYEFLIQ